MGTAWEESSWGRGEEALLAESANQPGWDIQIVDRFGEQVDVLQAKATDSMSYVKSPSGQVPGHQGSRAGRTGPSLLPRPRRCSLQLVYRILK